MVPRVYQEEFHLRADRDFQLPGWRDMDSGTAALLVEAGCRALRTDCSPDAAGQDSSDRFLKRLIHSDDYRGTAWLTRVRGGSYYARFVAPSGYSACRAGVYWKGGLVHGGVRLAGSIERSGLDGVAVYANLDPSADGVAEFRLLILYVAKAELASHGCWPDQTLLFLCRDGICQPSRAYPETDLR
ncbi:hypothetical protein [Kaistia algarum]|uniref:hypothetical protein n=1 Tax=Kaistia algarum TaxID=2083279 RepID=UPI00224CF2FB|nr:hypothetical protein [Kaistia algarum]MCX5514041.1 hypothetical protein [Kaistia algarum]